MKKWNGMKRKKFIIVLGLLIVAWIVPQIAGVFYYLQSKPTSIPERKLILDTKVENVSFLSSDGLRISAWLLKRSKEKAVILLAGIGGNRTYNLKRAEFYLNEGYSVLMPDLRGTGNSDKALISLGWHERNDLIAAYKFLVDQGFQKIGVHGSSMGASTIVFSFLELKTYDFVILESCYDNLHNALFNRLEKYKLPKIGILYLPAELTLGLILKVLPQRLSPELYIEKYKGPLLILAGGKEFQIKIEETEKLFEKSNSTDKQIHIFKKGIHENFLHGFPLEYKKVVHSFLDMLHESG